MCRIQQALPFSSLPCIGAYSVHTIERLSVRQMAMPGQFTKNTVHTSTTLHCPRKKTESQDNVTIYFNNAATSWPKPPEVIEAVRVALEEPPAEPGRTSSSEDPTFSCRQVLSRLFNVRNLNKVILTPSSTYALNMVIRGLLLDRRGTHCVTTTLEHNSILCPLEHLSQSHDIETTFIEPRSNGRLYPEELLAAVRPETALIALSHASNVTGCIQPVEEVIELAAELEIPVLVDASQSVGVIPLDYDSLPGRVFVAFAGHKGLFGPAGVGGLVAPDENLPQTFVGGTGVQSENPMHPSELPLRHEAGTMNLSGIAGLTAGVRFVRNQGLLNLGKHRNKLVQLLRNRLSEIDEVRLSPLASEDGRAGIVSFTLKGHSPEEIGFMLEEAFEIETRTGLHCAPRIHQGLGSMAEGSVRVSIAAFNTPQEIEQLAIAIRQAVTAQCVM